MFGQATLDHLALLIRQIVQSVFLRHSPQDFGCHGFLIRLRKGLEFIDEPLRRLGHGRIVSR